MNLLSLDNSNRFTAMSQYQKQSNILTHTISNVLCAGHPGWAGTRNDQITVLHNIHDQNSPFTASQSVMACQHVDLDIQWRHYYQLQS